MEASIRAAQDVRRKRHETTRKMKNEKFELMIQSLLRKTARLLGGNKSADLVPVETASPNNAVNPLSQSAVHTGSGPSSSNEKDDIGSPRSLRRRSFLPRLKSSGHRRSCPDLSASCHPMPRDSASLRRVVSPEMNHDSCKSS
jgi:hypothetical protein